MVLAAAGAGCHDDGLVRPGVSISATPRQVFDTNSENGSPTAWWNGRIVSA